MTATDDLLPLKRSDFDTTIGHDASVDKIVTFVEQIFGNSNRIFEIGVDQNRSTQNWSERSTEIGISSVDPLHIAHTEVGITAGTIGQVGTVQIGITQYGSTQRAIQQATTEQVGTRQVGFGE